MEFSGKLLFSRVAVAAFYRPYIFKAVIYSFTTSNNNTWLHSQTFSESDDIYPVINGGHQKGASSICWSKTTFYFHKDKNEFISSCKPRNFSFFHSHYKFSFVFFKITWAHNSAATFDSSLILPLSCLKSWWWLFALSQRMHFHCKYEPHLVLQQKPSSFKLARTDSWPPIALTPSLCK